MSFTFNVIYLGVFDILDTNEGNDFVENAGSLVGQTIGSVDDPLWRNAAEFSPGTLGPDSGGRLDAYDHNGDITTETFSINGGPDQVFDASVIYWATLTYTDGTTATISAVLIQDTNGNLYLAPEFSYNDDQVALEAKPLQSLTLNAIANDSAPAFSGWRQEWSIPLCFTLGANVATPYGLRPVEDLKVGDLVLTQDHGPQPIRWISRSIVKLTAALAPIRIEAGSLGQGLPRRDVVVSPQHRVLVRSLISERMFGKAEVLVAAKSLVGLSGITTVREWDEVTYIHVLFDRHEILEVEGAPFESLFLGAQSRKALRREVAQIFPAFYRDMVSARTIPPGRRQRRLAMRHAENAAPLLAYATH
jgi:hypothetical protein